MVLVPARKRFARRWWIVVIVVLCALAAWWFFGKRTSARTGPENRPVPVAVATAAQGDLPLFLGGLGTVTPANNVLVRSRVDGQLIRVLFQEGQLVHAGDLLAEIDPRPFQVQLIQAEGQRARDSALLKNTQLDLERYRTLWSQDSIAKQQVDAQEALVRQYEGAVQVDNGQVEDAKLQLVYAKVTAPITGRVGLRQVDPGNIVHASDATGIVLITQVQPVNVVFTLPEDNLPRIVQKTNAKTALMVDAYDRQQKLKLATGTLLSIDNQIDTTTGTVKLKAQFHNEDSALFPNQFVNVRMHVDTLRGVVMAPVNAVQRGAQSNFVYLLAADNTVKIQNVRVGDTEGNRVVIESGLQAGDQVVIEGLDKLREGSPVEVVSRDGQPLGGEARKEKSAEGATDGADKTKHRHKNSGAAQ
ncbi:MAG: mdtA [Verrucomicrobiaceae bacterium]|nr:mdtA [Verrucomicrobiaceae bacterium]